MARTAPTAKQDILRAARECIATSGFRGTTVREIAARYGGSKAAVLYHFESKDAILEAMLAEHWRAIQALAGELRGLPDGRAQERAITGLASIAVRHRDDLAILHSEVTEIIRLERFRDASDAFDDIADALVRRAEGPVWQIASRILIGGVAIVCHEFRESPDEDLHAGIVLVLGSVRHLEQSDRVPQADSVERA